MKRAVSLSVIGVVLFGCTGDDPMPVPATPSPAPTSADGGLAPSLQCPLNCLPPAPAGWRGPSAVYDGVPLDVPPACTGSYTLPEVTDRVHLAETAPHDCVCDVPRATGLACVMDLAMHGQPSCAGPASGSAKASSADECIALSGASVMTGSLTLDGSCTEVTARTIIPKPNLDRQLVACGLTQTAGCEGRPDCTATPLPLPTPFSRLCIHTDGEVACPSEDYAVRAVVGRVEDSRGCACPAVLEGDCADGIQTFADTKCVGTGTPVKAGGCLERGAIDGGASAGSFMIPSLVTAARCKATPTKTGGLAMTAPVTFCCNK